MTIPQFKHVSAKSLDQAKKAAAKPLSTVIAGGTDLLGTLKDRIHPTSPDTLVDLKTIPGLSYIREERKTLRVGAVTSLSEIAHHPLITEKFPALAEAARSVASPQIRNMGTVSGNICQEPRCWYYRSPENQFHCMRKGGSKCGALLGDNRYHSVFGGVRMSQPSCTATCPGHVEIGQYLEQLRAGNHKEAARIILQNNPLPALTGRVCPHTCQSQCNRKNRDGAVEIRNVERFMGDFILNHSGELMKAPKKKTGKAVAIVGAGPAGLSAAYYLACTGNSVTVFDRMPEAGGMLRYAIPSHRLSKDMVRKQIRALEKMGIQFKLKTAIGKKELAALRRKYKAVFLATGAWKQRALPIEHSELLLSGMDFLTRAAQGSAPAPADRVVVIGGGNVAIDVAITAKRAGAKQVTMVCLEARDKMPAFPEEIEEALKAGVEIHPSFGPNRILQTSGTLTGIELVRCSSVLDQQGRFNPSFDPDQTETLPADQVILAIGQTTELDFADKSLKRAGSLIQVDGDTFATNIKGVFAGGDVTSGPATVIHAISAGRRAADAVQAYLSGKTSEAPAALNQVTRFTSASQQEGKSSESPESKTAREEASRCINCSCIAVSASDIAPVLLALDATIKTTQRSIEAANFFTAKQASCTILEPGELVKEIEIPSPNQNSSQRYYKFRIRNSIDFPIVSLAVVLGTRKDKFHQPKLVLGAVAPIPYRLTEVERFLHGKAPTEEVASVAAEIATRETQPLAKNGFKVQVIRALVKRAILGAASAKI